MEHFYFWESGMWIFPTTGLVIMLFCMMIFGRRCFAGSHYRFPCSWHGDHDRYTKDNSGSESALEILNKRYASGEISKEEYERIKRDILS
jgi:putative membrane protein